MNRIFYLVILVLFLAGLILIVRKNFTQKISEKTVDKPELEFEQSPFVRAKDEVLYVNGERFRSVGVNRYNLLSYDVKLHCANSFSEQDITRMFGELQDLGITTLRFWLFQSFTSSGEDLNRFDFVIQKAKEYGIRLIPVFENHWADCTEGKIKDDSWYETGYQSTYGNYTLSLKDYIKKIVPLYQDESAILAWQLMNEVEPENETVLVDFAKELSKEIRSLDKNHLISLGTTGTKQTTKTYQQLHSLETIDLLEYHDYNEPENKFPQQLVDRFNDAESLHKPLMMGESGVYRYQSDYQNLLEEKMTTFFDKGGSLYLLWAYGDPSVTDDGHNFDLNSSLAPVIKSIAGTINNDEAL